MERMFNKKLLAGSLVAAFMGMMGLSPLALADEGESAPAAEPAPATEAAAEAAPEAAAESAAEEAAPAEDAAPAAE